MSLGFKMDPKDRREVSVPSDSCQVDILISESWVSPSCDGSTVHKAARQGWQTFRQRGSPLQAAVLGRVGAMILEEHSEKLQNKPLKKKGRVA